MGDVDGDGRSDLVTWERWNELAVHLGTAGGAPFASLPIRVKLGLPAANGTRRAWLADLHGDGRVSVLIQQKT